MPIALVFAMALVTGLKLQAGAGPERVWFSQGKVLAVSGDTIIPLTQDIELPNHIIVSTNGTFKVGTYPPRPFAEGQVLASDGMLTSPDGSIEPVIDHVGMLAGKTVSVVDGGKSTASGDVPLGKDQVLTSDRALLGRNGSWMRIIDGMLFAPDGKTIPALDTISLQQGKVVVQKEGALITMQPGRSIMMNEGTKVFGDGRVLSKEGKTTTLTEAQILTIEGVVKRR